jgi:hypothetical protein
VQTALYVWTNPACTFYEGNFSSDETSRHHHAQSFGGWFLWPSVSKGQGLRCYTGFLGVTPAFTFWRRPSRQALVARKAIATLGLQIVGDENRTGKADIATEPNSETKGPCQTSHPSTNLSRVHAGHQRLGPQASQSMSAQGWRGEHPGRTIRLLVSKVHHPHLRSPSLDQISLRDQADSDCREKAYRQPDSGTKPRYTR